MVVVPSLLIDTNPCGTRINLYPLEPICYLLNPLNDVVVIATRIKNLNETIDLTSKEGINLKLDVTLQYHIDFSKSGEIYQKFGTNKKEFLMSRITALVRQTIVNYNLNSIYGNQRELIANKLHQTIKNDLQSLGFMIDKVSLQNVVLPDAIATSLQDKFLATQLADKRRIEAKGIVDSQKILRDIFPPQTVINVAADDSTLQVKQPK
jgi:prohibitin 1